MWWGKNRDVRVVRDYVAALNSRDIVAIRRLIGPSCVFIDSRNGAVRGHDQCVEASRRFFALDLDYDLDVATVVAHPPDVLITGTMRSTDNRLARDCLWRARCENGKLVEWQSFADGPGLNVARLLMPEVATYVS